MSLVSGFSQAKLGPVKGLCLIVLAGLLAALAMANGMVAGDVSDGDVIALEALGAPPVTPSNVSPADDATGVSLNPTLQASAFSDNDTGDTHLASQWQITTTADNFTSPAFDSNTDNVNLIQIVVPANVLSDNTTYFWHVRYQDSQGAWSEWSAQTSFTTLNHQPGQPVNVAPSDNATEVSLNPTLQSSPFADPDQNDTHASSQWRITATSENYTNPVFDVTTDNVSLTEIAVPTGKLSDNTTYYWQVRYRDNHGAWSEWSTQTLFTTLNHQPGQPVNVVPPDNAAEVSLNPTLQSSPFADPDMNDTHASSEWRITATSENYTSPVFDVTTDNVSLTEIAVPAGKLNDNAKYYWQVRYQDNHGAWSEWSAQTSFTTLNHPPSAPTITSPLSGDNVTVTATLQGSAFSDPDSGDTHGASRWQITRTAGDYSTTVLDDITIRSSELTAVTVYAGVLAPNNTYYWRVKHQDNHGAWSEWSAEAAFVTVDRPPDKPVNLTPKSGSLGVITTPRLESPFSDPDGDADYAGTQWQITATGGDYGNVIWEDTSSVAHVTIPEGMLNMGTTYYWRVRHQDKEGAWSEWSDEASFTTWVGLPPSGGGELPFWAWLLIALGGAAIVGVAVVAALRLRREP